MNLAAHPARPAWVKDPSTVFNVLDKGGDGSISYDEWMSGFERLDGDGDGVIRRWDWSLQMGETDIFDTLKHKEHDSISREEWRAAFFQLDTNRDRRISPEEWTALCNASYGVPPTPPPTKGFHRLAPSERLLGSALDHLCSEFGLDREEVYVAVRQALPEEVWEALWKGMISDDLGQYDSTMQQTADGQNRRKSQPPSPAANKPVWLRSGPGGWQPANGRMTPLPQDASDAGSDRIHYVFGRNRSSVGRNSQADHRWDSDNESDDVAPPPRFATAAGAAAARRGRRQSVDLTSFKEAFAAEASAPSRPPLSPPTMGAPSPASARRNSAGRLAFAAGMPNSTPGGSDTQWSTGIGQGGLSPEELAAWLRDLPSTRIEDDTKRLIAKRVVEHGTWSNVFLERLASRRWAAFGVEDKLQASKILELWKIHKPAGSGSPSSSGTGQGGLSPEELAAWLRHIPSTRIEDDTKRLIAKSVVEQGVWSDMFLERLASRQWAAFGVEDQWQASKILELWKLRKPDGAPTLTTWMKSRMSPMVH